MSPEQFRGQLQNLGMTESIYKENLKNQILQSKLLNYEVRSKIIITEEMILDHYDTQYTKHVEQGGYYLLQMGFLWKKDQQNTDKVSPAAKLEAKRRLSESMIWS